MREQDITHLKDSDYKRLTGVRRETFDKMRVEIEAQAPQFGRPPKLSSGDQLLMTLMYWREYRTQFHISQSYGVSESHVSRTVRKVEDILVRSGQFTLPGKKVLQASDLIIEAILVDATEQPIERPKKSSASTTAAKRNAIPRRLNS
jgi:Helix-turn-helix of DDE superfamily endonuclease